MVRREQLNDFVQAKALLLLYAQYRGIPIREGDAFRSRAQAIANAAAGSGIADSKHCYSLAADIWIDPTGKNPIYSKEQLDANPLILKQYEDLGKFWVFLGHIWGGNFPRKDFVHFEFKEKPEGT
jgi:hypothetical protein